MSARSRAYAARTTVDVDRTRIEIEALLKAHGATQRGVSVDDTRSAAVVSFTLAPRNDVLRLRQVAILLPLPKPDDFRPTHDARRRSAQNQYEQECRRRWRALLLVLKAKLELIEIGASTIDREFLADIRMLDGQPVHIALTPQIQEMYARGTPPALLAQNPTFAGGSSDHG